MRYFLFSFLSLSLCASCIFSLPTSTSHWRPSRISPQLGATAAPSWHVWKAVECLEEEGGLLASNPGMKPLCEKTVSILRDWGESYAGSPEYQGLLNKSTLRKEVEESIVALHHLLQWLERFKGQNLTIVDVCCGKGVFSILSSSILSEDPRIKEIIMLDKATMDWSHISLAQILIRTWGGCNLHEIDQMVQRLDALDTPVALVGIHLCKTLSPTCVGIVNSLSTTQCPFLCLVPCCLPRAVSTVPKKQKQQPQISNKNGMIPVRQYETPLQRKERVAAAQRRAAATARTFCVLCNSTNHTTYNCGHFVLPSSTSDSKEHNQEIFLRSPREVRPCWKCGEIGHVKADCPSNQTAGRPSLIQPPTALMDVSNVLAQDNPFQSYCRLLADTIQRNNVHLQEETRLVANHQETQGNNWNNARKSIYIVAY